MKKVELKNDKYPELLRKIGKEAPKQLYYKGEWQNDIFENCLAVVGSRRMTTYGKQITQKLVGQIASAGITIVSGFMYGVDAAAHKSVVETGGKTIAVMPCGIDRVHPEYQIKLYNDILENNGLIISEYEGDSQPGYWTYPARNRIVAGLSKAVLVVEAGEKSGSLITANLGKKFDRKVFAVPGPLTSVLSFGTNQLIKNRDAEMVNSAEDILKFYNKGIKKTCNKPGLLQGLEGQILGLLQRDPVGLDNLARELDISIPEISRLVSLMEIKGQLKKENNKYYVS